jgi:hypothetical protein
MSLIYFEKFKLLKEKKYRFSGKKEKNLYFAYLTINQGLYAYRDAHIDYLDDKLTVYFSWFTLFKYLPIPFIAIGLFFLGRGLSDMSVITFGFSFLIVLASLIVRLFLEKFYTKYKFTKAFLAGEFLDETSEKQSAREVIEEFENRKPWFMRVFRNLWRNAE